MFSPQRTDVSLSEHLRMAACLVHAVPGAVARIDTVDGDRHVVAHHRSDATLSPCQLRTALLAPLVVGVPHLANVIRRVEIVGGIVDLGGGLHQRSHPAALDERWFATTLSPDDVTAIAASCPPDVDHRETAVRICADVDLAVSAVCISASAPLGIRLDEAAAWLRARCLVEELIGDLSGPSTGR